MASIGRYATTFTKIVRDRVFWPFGVTPTVTEHTPTFFPCTLVPLVLQKRVPAFDTVTFTFDDFGAEMPANTVIVFASTFLPTFTDNTRRTVDGDVTAGTVTAVTSPPVEAVACEAPEEVVAGVDAAPVVVDGEPCTCAESDDGVVVATVTATVVATVGTVTVAGTVAGTVVWGAAVVTGTVLRGVVVPTFCAGVIPNPAIVTALDDADPTGAPLPRSPVASYPAHRSRPSHVAEHTVPPSLLFPPRAMTFDIPTSFCACHTSRCVPGRRPQHHT